MLSKPQLLPEVDILVCEPRFQEGEMFFLLKAKIRLYMWIHQKSMGLEIDIGDWATTKFMQCFGSHVEGG